MINVSLHQGSDLIGSHKPRHLAVGAVRLKDSRLVVKVDGLRTERI